MHARRRFFFAVAVLAVLCCSGLQWEDCRCDIRWVRTSIEYQMLCLQTYRSAWEHVRSRAPSLQQNWAVVLDVDMTVLDNSVFQETQHKEGKRFPSGWSDYISRAACPSLPGAVAFVDSVRSLGEYAHIVYITDRGMLFEDPTRENLRKAGLWKEGDVLMCRPDREDGQEPKAIRRAEVAQGTGRCEGMGERVIVAVIGDQFSDVADIPSAVPPENLKEYYSRPENRRENWFILPNPMYGKWMGGYR